MKNSVKNVMFVLAGAIVIGFLSGCTNWKKKYTGLDVEHQNLKGLYENCVASLDGAAAEKARLGQALTTSEKTIEELQQQIRDRNISPGEATGFGDDYDVSVDAAAGTITVTLPNAILFSPGKASLRKSSISELDHVLSVIKQKYRNKDIDIVGHTDSDPVKKSKKYWKDNWELSAERALTVLRYMERKGINDDRIRAVASGASRPVASNSTSSGKAKNRRVEIVVNMRS